MTDNEIRIDDLEDVTFENMVTVPQTKYDWMLESTKQLELVKQYVEAGNANIDTIKALLGISEVKK